MATTHVGARARRPAPLVVGVLLCLLAVSQLVPLIISSALPGSESPWLRLAGLAAFGLPLVLLLVAGAGLVRLGLGVPGAPTALPSSRTGWVAVGAVLASLASLVVLATAATVVRDSLPTDEFFDQPWLAVPLLLAGALAAVSLVAGAAAVVRRDRSAAVLAALAVGWFFVTFGAGEALFEH